MSSPEIKPTSQPPRGLQPRSEGTTPKLSSNSPKQQKEYHTQDLTGKIEERSGDRCSNSGSPEQQGSSSEGREKRRSWAGREEEDGNIRSGLQTPRISIIRELTGKNRTEEWLWHRRACRSAEEESYRWSLDRRWRNGSHRGLLMRRRSAEDGARGTSIRVSRFETLVKKKSDEGREGFKPIPWELLGNVHRPPPTSINLTKVPPLTP